MTRVLVTHPRSRLDQYFGARALQQLQAIADVRLNTHDRELEQAELVRQAQDCDAVIAYRQTPGPRTLFEQLPQLAAFIRCAVDIRTVDVVAASDHGVLVTQASAGYVAAVSEWVVAMMVDLGRGISRHVAQYAQGTAPLPVMGLQLRGSTLGIIGHGQIGSDLSRIALALGMQVLVHTPEPVRAEAGLRAVPFEELLAQSDFVVCLAPANAKTEKLVGASAFAAMKPGAYFINASRGELVDDDALLAALDSGRLAGCALDVGRAPDQMPTLRLASHPRVLATPHIGGLTMPAIEHQALETVAQLRALLAGEIPRGAVNADRATRIARWRKAAA